MIPVKGLSGEEALRHYGEDTQADHFLDDLQLYESERSAVVNETKTVGRHLTAVLEERDSPGEYDCGNQRPVA